MNDNVHNVNEKPEPTSEQLHYYSALQPLSVASQPHSAIITSIVMNLGGGDGGQQLQIENVKHLLTLKY